MIPSSGGFQRFCSNYLATSKEGFDRDILFTNEESPDYVFRQEDSWPPPIGDPDEEENGVVLALDVKSEQYHVIYGMGRHNHENNVAIPGFDDLVVLSGDDTFTSGPLTDPGRSGTARRRRPGPRTVAAVLVHRVGHGLAARRRGRPLGVRRRRPDPDDDFNDYYDFAPGSTQTVTGHFIKVPKNIATGKNADGSEVKAADVGYPLPPTNGSWQRDLRSVATPTTHRSASTVPSGCSSTGASSTTSSTSSASRTSRTTSDRAWATSSTSSTRAAGGGPPTRQDTPFVNERPRLEDGARPERPDEGDLVLDRVRRG